MNLPMVIPYRNGHVKLGKKIFSKDDVNAGFIMREALISDPNWFGGRVYQFGKNATYKGLYLCMEGQIDDKGNAFPGTDVIGLYIRDLTELSDESKQLLKDEGYMIDDSTPETKPAIAITNETAPTPEIEPETLRDIVKDAATVSAITDMVNKRIAARAKKGN